MISRSSRWQAIFKFYNKVCAKSLTVTKHVWARRVLFSSLLCALAVKTQKYFPNFHPKRMIAENQATRYYHRWLEIRINLIMNVESKYCDDCNISVKAVTHYRVI